MNMAISDRISRVLIVHADQVEARQIIALLGALAQNAIFHTTPSCAGALMYMHVRIPDLIIIDSEVQKNDSMNLVDQLKKHPQFRRVPAVVLTDSDSDTIVTRPYQGRANMYLCKPPEGGLGEVVATIWRFWSEYV